MTDMEGYDPRKSKVSENTMSTWRNATISGDLTEVPGIGPAAADKLADDEIESNRITNTYQLFGKYLMLKGPDTDEFQVDIVTHNDKFWFFLKEKGITAHRSAIVKAIAEKAASWFPSLYDANIYEAEDDE